jgi:hypothetical protein
MTRIAPYLIAALALGLSACTNLMILSNAALAGAFWERLRVLPLEQRRVAGRVPPSEQRSEGQPGYLGESLVHLHRHRAPISATQPTATRRTDLLRTDIRATPSPAILRAMDTQPTQDSQLTPPRVTDRQVIRDTPPTPDPRPLRRQAAQDSPLTPVLRAMVFRARRPILPTPVPVTEIPSLAIPVIAFRRTGRLGPSTRSNLLAEFWPDTKSSRRCAGGWSGR